MCSMYVPSMWKAVGRKTAGSLEASLSYTTTLSKAVCGPTHNPYCSIHIQSSTTVQKTSGS